MFLAIGRHTWRVTAVWCIFKCDMVGWVAPLLSAADKEPSFGFCQELRCDSVIYCFPCVYVYAFCLNFGFCGELGNYFYTSPCCTTVYITEAWESFYIYVYKTQLCSTKPCCTPSVRSEARNGGEDEQQ